MAAEIDLNFEFNAPHFVDFSQLHAFAPDDSWFDTHHEDSDDNESNEEEGCTVGLLASTPKKTAQTPKRVKPLQQPKLTVPHSPKLHTKARIAMKNVVGESSNPIAEEKIAKNVRHAHVTEVQATSPKRPVVAHKPKLTVPKPFKFQTDARQALRKMDKPEEVLTTESRGLTSPTNAHLKKSRLPAKLTVPRSPQLSTSMRSKMRALSEQSVDEASQAEKEMKQSKAKKAPLKQRGMTRFEPFTLASEQRARMRDALKSDAEEHSAVSEAPAEASKPVRKAPAAYSRPRLTKAVSPALSTRMRAKQREMMEQEVQKAKDAAKIGRRATCAPSKRAAKDPRLTAVQPFNLRTSVRSARSHTNELRAEELRRKEAKKAEEDNRMYDERASRVRRGPTIPKPFQLQSEKRAAAAGSMKALENNKRKRDTMDGGEVHLGWTLDIADLFQSEAKRLRLSTASTFKARPVPASLYAPFSAVPAGQKQLKVPQTERKARPTRQLALKARRQTSGNAQ